MKEVWKDIIGFEGMYQISNYGNVKAKERTVNHCSGGKRRMGEKTLRPFINTRGYYQVNLYKNGKRKTYTIHKLVMLSFVGECPADMEIRHLNSKPTDNRLCNLVYGTHSENMIDVGKLCRLRHQKLTQQDVQDIRHKIDAGKRVNDVAKEYGVCRRTICDIKNHHTYTWL